MTCPAKFEPWVSDNQRTHMCGLPDGHPDIHCCPTCGTRWAQARVAAPAEDGIK